MDVSSPCRGLVSRSVFRTWFRIVEQQWLAEDIRLRGDPRIGQPQIMPTAFTRTGKKLTANAGLQNSA